LIVSNTTQFFVVKKNNLKTISTNKFQTFELKLKTP